MKKEDYLKNMKTANRIFNRIENINPCSAWNRGVARYALELLNSIDVGEEITKKNLLNGAKDWKEYSEGGCALIYDVNICHRLCTPSEIKKTKDGNRRPNKRETWLDVQARALYQAECLIMKIKKEVEE